MVVGYVSNLMILEIFIDDCCVIYLFWLRLWWFFNFYNFGKCNCDVYESLISKAYYA